MLDEQRSITYWQDKWEEVFKENQRLIKEIKEATEKINEFNKIIRELKRIQKEINTLETYNGLDRIGYMDQEEWKKKIQRF